MSFRIVRSEFCPCKSVVGEGISLTKISLAPNKEYQICGQCHVKKPLNLYRGDCFQCGYSLTIPKHSGNGKWFRYCPKCFPYTRQLLENSNIPQRYWNKTPDEHSTNRICLRDIRDVKKNISLIKNGSWLLTGHTGCGKTLHASNLGRTLVEEWLKRVTYIQISDHLNTLKGLFARTSRESYADETLSMMDEDWGYYRQEKERIKAGETLERLLNVKSAPILIVDDLNRIYRTRFEQDYIYELTDYRYRKELFTVFTTQFRDLKEILPEQTASRIKQMSFEYYLGETNRRTQ